MGRAETESSMGKEGNEVPTYQATTKWCARVVLHLMTTLLSDGKSDPN